MNSKERHEARYQRRKQARHEKALAKMGDAQDFEKVFSFAHMYRSAHMCFKSVGFKASVQSYRARCGINVARKQEDLMNGKLTLGKSPEFYIRERGRIRRINSIGIVDRVPQKCNSKYALKPVLHRSLVYDNYASREGLGTSKARLRLKLALVRHIRRYGMTGGVITLDLHHFFDSIPHERIKKQLFRNFTDRRIIGFNMRIVRHNRDKVGLVLGSENSQDFAASTLNDLDHYMKQDPDLHVEFSGRYNDDIVIIDPDYDRLKTIFQKIKDFLTERGFELNEKKSRIVRFGKQFSVLKRKYDFTPTGKIIVRPDRSSVIRERRKLKRLHRKYLAGEISLKTCYDSMNAWLASISGIRRKKKKKRYTEMDRISLDTRSYKIKRSMWQLFDNLFIWPWVNGQEERREPCITS